MPRKARIDIPGALHHIIIRGIERSPIFEDAEDYENFLTRLGIILTETATACYAWALLTNHAHLLMRTGMHPVTTVMRRLLTGYAQQFNRRHARHGYLFQNRYKSFLVEAEPYLLELVRYIHLNPVRAGIIPTMEVLDSYPKTGHAVIMGRTSRSWQDTASVLAFCGSQSGYRAFIEKGISLGRRPELTGGGLVRSAGGWLELKKDGIRLQSDERILGSSEFVNSVLKKTHEEYEKRLLLKATGLTLNTLITGVAHYLGIDEALIKSAIKQRAVSRARAIITHLAVDRLKVTNAEIGRTLNLTASAVSKLAVRGRVNSLSQAVEDNLPGFRLRE